MAESPDWSAIAGNIDCPLCEYNLRGLIEPRCPECGHAFRWQDVIDPTRRIHPYLFEHHPDSDVRSFVRTLVGGLNPWRFWRKLRPEQPSRPKRLVLYWLISVVIGAGMLLMPYAWSIVNFRHQTFQRRPFLQQMSQYVDESGAPISAAWIEDRYPLPPSAGFFQAWWRSGGPRYLEMPRHIIALLVLAVVVWPWLTWASLLLFFQTRRLSKLKRTHVLRCVLYSADMGPWLLLGFIGLSAWATWRSWPGAIWWQAWSGTQVVAVLGWMTLVLLLFACMRLAVGLSRYLRYPHAPAVVVGSQVVIVLAVITVLAAIPPVFAFLLQHLWFP